eukprot:1396844-Amphidinium_carterae.1
MAALQNASLISFPPQLGTFEASFVFEWRVLACSRSSGQVHPTSPEDNSKLSHASVALSVSELHGVRLNDFLSRLHAVIGIVEPLRIQSAVVVIGEHGGRGRGDGVCHGLPWEEQRDVMNSLAVTAMPLAWQSLRPCAHF